MIEHLQSYPNIKRCLFLGGWGSIVVAVFVSYIIGHSYVGEIYVGESYIGESALDKAWIGTATVYQFSLAFVGMVLLWWFGPSSNDLKDYRIILMVAVILRVLLIPVDHYTSNDSDRYLFDGHLLNLGFDPYQVKHEDERLTAEVEAWQPPQEHLGYETLYPPMALWLFSQAAETGPYYAELTWKVMTGLASVCTLLLMVLVLAKANKLKHLSLIAFSPILLFEAGVGAHVDAFTALTVALTIYCIQLRSWFFVGAVLGLGLLIKILPVVLMVPIFMGLNELGHRVKCAVGLITTVVGGYGLAFFMGLKPIGSIGVFFENFRFGSPYFYWMESIVELNTLAWITLALVIVCFACVTWFSFRSDEELLGKLGVHRMQFAMAIPLLFSPVLYPWYLSPLVPLLALAPSPFLLAWTALMPLTYEVLNDFICCYSWQPAQWPIYLLTLLGGLLMFNRLKLIGQLNFMKR